MYSSDSSQFKVYYRELFPEGNPLASVTSKKRCGLRKPPRGINLSDDEEDEVQGSRVSSTPDLNYMALWEADYNKYMKTEHQVDEGETLVNWWLVNVFILPTYINELIPSM